MRFGTGRRILSLLQRNIYLLCLLLLCLALTLMVFIDRPDLVFASSRIGNRTCLIDRRFLQPTTDHQQTAMLKTIQTFDRVMNSTGVSYFLIGGSLIGAYRHHGPVPWDDDFDVLVNGSQRRIVLAALSALAPEYHVLNVSGHPWKFFPAKGLKHFEGQPYTWPYLDIFFFVQTKTHVFLEVNYFRHELNYPTNKMFPVQRRPFGSLYLPVPCDMEMALSYFGNLDICMSRTYSHKENKAIRSTKISCSWLSCMYPFVKRTKLKIGWNESLVYHNKVYSTITVPEYC